MASLPGAEVIVVDDCSTDKTAEIVKNTEAVLIRHEENMGYGVSLRRGIASSMREYVLFCDADGQHTAEDVSRLIGSCDGYAVTVGTRGKGFYSSINRASGKLVLRTVANFLAARTIPDLHSGLRLQIQYVIEGSLCSMPEGFSF